MFRDFCGDFGIDSEYVTKALQNLLFNQYWTRAWIVQEVVLGNKVDVWCRWKTIFGEWECEVIDHYELVGLYLYLGRIFEVKAKGLTSASARVMDLFRCSIDLVRGNLELLDIGSLLIQFGSCQCSDVRDRVYSLTGLILTDSFRGITVCTQAAQPLRARPQQAISA